MKLVKLSLAAIVAAGALSSVASATPLEEAIKNVDVSGFARYRFTSTNTDGTANGGTSAEHRFTSNIDFKVALDDNFFGIVGFRYDSKDASGEPNGQTMVTQADPGVDNYGQTFNVRQFLLGYKAGNTTIQAGRQVLGTFFTDDMVGTGLKVLNTDIPGITLAAVAFDDLQNDKDLGYRNFAYTDRNGAAQTLRTYNHNLYGVAAIGSYDPVSFQLWYAMLEDVADLYAIDAAVNFDVNEDITVGLHGQYAGSSLDSELVDSLPVGAADDADFYAVEASAKGFGFDGRAGYVNFSAGDNAEVGIISLEDQGKFIEAGEDLFDIYKQFSGNNNYWFLVAGYTFDKFRIGVDYVMGETTNRFDDRGTADAYELVGRINYNYSKKLKFQTWWSHIEIDGKTRGATKYEDIERDRFRFEARYNF